MIIRPALLSDARAIAEVHVRAWRHAYRGLVPDAFLAAMSIDAREATWRQDLALGAPRAWVAEVGGIIGWACADESRDADAPAGTGELWAIYVDPSHWRRAVGRRLWQEAEQYFLARQFSNVTLWVLKDNPRARAFYLAMGFLIEPGEARTRDRGGTRLAEIRLRRPMPTASEQGDAVVSVISVLPDASDAVDLIEELDRDLAARYPGANIHGLRPDEIGDPRLLFLVAYASGRPIACGALREFQPEVGEMKRLFVRPDWRGRGVARRLVTELERRAAGRGFQSVRLETGRQQPEAIALYQSAGYTTMPPFGEYRGPNSVCFQKTLTSDPQVRA